MHRRPAGKAGLQSARTQPSPSGRKGSSGDDSEVGSVRPRLSGLGRAGRSRPAGAPAATRAAAAAAACVRSVAAPGVGLEDAALRVEGGLREAGGGVDATGRKDAAVDQREEEDPHNGENETWSAAPRGGQRVRRGASWRHSASLWEAWFGYSKQ
jgi:hypothetical protein